MEFSDDPEKLKEWIPLIMETELIISQLQQRKSTTEPMSILEHSRANWWITKRQQVHINYNHVVDDIKRTEDGAWEVKVRNFERGTLETHTANFVFIGAGGGALPLLQKPASLKVNMSADFR